MPPPAPPPQPGGVLRLAFLASGTSKLMQWQLICGLILLDWMSENSGASKCLTFVWFPFKRQAKVVANNKVHQIVMEEVDFWASPKGPKLSPASCQL